MGDKRGSDYINLGAQYGAPRPDSGGIPRPDPTRGPVFVSHEETLRRDLRIINARTAAELGPLPLGGVPVQVKRKIDAKGRPLPQLSDAQTNEEEAMNLNQIAAAAAMAAAMVACEPQTGTEAAEQMQTPAPAAEQPLPVASETRAKPKVATVSERATTDAAPAIPGEIRAFVPPDSTLLAYKRFDLTGDGTQDAVLIIHHPASDEHSNDAKNPCDLVVLHGEGDGFTLAGKGSEVVDCTYKNYLDGTNRPDDLNYMIELSKHKVVCNYESDRPMGTSTFYTFEFSKRRNAWYLSQARNAYKSSDRNGRGYLAIEEINYPTDVGFIEIDKFDPKKLKEAFKRNKEIEFFEEEHEGLEG